MDISRLCYNCFKEKPDSSGPCPYCGFDLEENAKKYPVALRAGTVLNGRYLIGRVLGQGGFGITYLAWDRKLGARMAVKEYMPNEIAARIGTTVSVAMKSRAEDFAYGEERFQEEARTLAKFMGQPNIAGVTDYFDENDTSYFVMDYIEGISFKTYIANQGGTISAEEALDVMIPVLRALTAVHAEGFIHRDVTPDNIHITKDGNVKLLDFGSARYSLGDKSKSLDVILKVGYAPKEQYTRRGRQGPYTDVYSCAACLYAAITGFLPPESLERLDHDTLIPPSEAGAELPLYLERAILKGLAVQPEERFQTAEEFLEVLESQQIVELPKGMGESNNKENCEGQGETQQKRTQPEETQTETQTGGRQTSAASRSLLPKIVGAAAAAAVLFAAGAVWFSGNRSSIGTGEASKQPDGVHITAAAEPLAPMVMIAGEEYRADIEELDLTGKQLTDGDLINLGQMTNLKKLILEENNEISDLSPLSGLTSLETLQLPSPSLIEDLSPIAGLTNLTYLSIAEGWGNQQPISLIQDYSPLSGFTKLTELDLSVTGLSDFSFLQDMTELETLRLLGSIQTNDLTFLSGLTNLKELRVFASDLVSISGVENLKNLEYLRITDLSERLFLEDLTFLEGLTYLETLRIDVYGVGSLHGLENLTKLEMAEFMGGRGSTYRDVEPIRNLTGLKTLRLPRMAGENQKIVYNGDGLAGLTNLTELTLPPSIENLKPLQSLSNLQTLQIRYGGNLSRGNWGSLGLLADLTNLRTLDVWGESDVTDLSPLSGLTQLTTLSVNLPGTRERVSLAPLSSLTGLQSLDLNIKHPGDLSPLAALTNLQTLTVRNASEITDWSPVAHVPAVSKEE